MANMNVELPESFIKELEAIIKDAYRKALEEGKRDAAIQRDYITKLEALELYKVSNNTLNLWHEQGLPQLKVGGKIYLRKSDIHQFLDRHEV